MQGEDRSALDRYVSSIYKQASATAEGSATGNNKRARYNRPAASSADRTNRNKGPGRTTARRGAASPPPAPVAPPKNQNWWERAPVDVTELLRQLSVNAGQIGMPGGPSGAVVMPAFGSGRQAVMNPDMRTYGQVPGMGEATFFTQGMNGGMAPISAMSPIGVPQNWNPVGANSGGSAARNK